MIPCQYGLHGPVSSSATHVITYRTAPLVGRHRGPGLMLDEAVCDRCRPARAVEIEANGGTVVGLRALPEPAAERRAG